MSRRRILILRPDNIGDVVLFSGAFRHIRSLYPDAHITLAVQDHIVNLVELCPYIDACVAIDRLTWWGRIGQRTFPFMSRIEHLLRRLNRLVNSIWNPFHTIIFPVKSPQVCHLETLYCLGSKDIIGITGCRLNAPVSSYPAELSPHVLVTKGLDVSNTDHWVHELSTSFNFLRFAGCQVTSLNDIKPRFWLSHNEKSSLENLHGRHRTIIGLFPGTSYEKKCWESDNYGKLTGLLKGSQTYVIFGSLSDRDLTNRVALSIKERSPDAEILNLAGQTTLRELVRTIMSCDLFIGTDSSGLHIAIAANIPTIGIVGGGHFGRFIPWGNPAKHIFLTHKMDCFHCNWQCSKQEVDCIQNVSPLEVATTVNKLLKRETDL
jgi:ADP-heptose:LPS heptosyltransferase